MKILALTDFSGNAHNALLTAVKLARCYGAEIIFMHAMSGPVVPATSPAEVYTSLYSSLRDQLQQKLLEESRSLYQQVGLSPSELLKQIVLLPTPLPDAILQEVTRSNVDLIVIGSTGKNGLKKLLLGSNTLEMINLTPVPLMVVPLKYNFKGFNVITVVVEHAEITERYGLRILERFVHTFSSSTQFLLLQDNDGEPAPEVQEIFPGLEINNLQQRPDRFNLVKKGSDMKELKRYLKSAKTDLIVSVPKQNSRWTDSFSCDLAEEIIDKYNVPMLVIPQAYNG